MVIYSISYNANILYHGNSHSWNSMGITILHKNAANWRMFLCHSRNDLTFISHSFQTYYTAARYSDKCCLSRPRPLITAWQNDFHILPWFRTSQDSLTETIPNLPRLTTSHDSMIESQSYLPWFRTSHDSATESSPNLPRLTTAYDGRHVRFRLGSFWWTAEICFISCIPWRGFEKF